MMNRGWKFISIGTILIFVISIGAVMTDVIGKYDKSSKTIELYRGEDLILPCHPEYPDSIIDTTDFEWLMDDVVPIFIRGRLSAFVLISYVDSPFEFVNSFLHLHTTELQDHLKLTCRLTRLHTEYTYSIRMKEHSNSESETNTIVRNVKEVTLNLPCFSNDFNSTSAAIDYTWLVTNEERTCVKAISLNRRLLLENNADNFRISEDGSLKILIPTPGLVYECQTSSSSNSYKRRIYSITEVSYDGTPIAEQQEDNKILDCSKDTPFVKREKLSVRFGARDTILPCPAINQNENAWSEWVFEPMNFQHQNEQFLLFINERKLAYWEHNKHYEIREDRSLVIRLMDLNQFGKYICRWSTGEKYFYEIERSIKVHAYGIWANPGDTLELSCPIEDPDDLDLNLIMWHLENTETDELRSFSFTDGILITAGSHFPLPNNVNLADDKQSLIVSDISITDSKSLYVCSFLRSGITYSYSVHIKGVSMGSEEYSY